MTAGKEADQKDARINAEELHAIAELRATLNLEKEPAGSPVRRFCTDQCLARYLRARAWNVKKAEIMLKDTLEWRATNKVDDITFESVAGEAATGKMYRLLPRDKRGRPVLAMRPGRENTSAHEGQVKHLIYNMELVCRSVEAEWTRDPLGGHCSLDSEQILLYIDFTGYSMWNAPPMKTSREILHILQGHYPERLGTAVLFNAPTLFHAAYKLIKPFVDARTLAKIVFVDVDVAHREAIRPELLRIFDALDELEESLGGDGKFDFDLPKYTAQMTKEDGELRQRREAFAKGAGPACP